MRNPRRVVARQLKISSRHEQAAMRTARSSEGIKVCGAVPGSVAPVHCLWAGVLRVNGDGAVIQCVQISRFVRRAQRRMLRIEKAERLCSETIKQMIKG